MKRFALMSLVALFVISILAPPDVVAQLFRRVPVQRAGAIARARIQATSTKIHIDSKIHMLFVWGTKATDTRVATEISKKKIEDLISMMQGSLEELAEGLGNRNHNYVGTVLTLEGNDASPQNILDACRKLAQNARPNDAVLVYILCHGASVVEDDDTTGTRVHALSPLAENAENLNLRTIGIRRSSILREMKSSQHRLDMLVTDACSVLRSEPKLGRERMQDRMDSASWDEFRIDVPVLVPLLLAAEGTININSSHPDKGSMNQGELALAWVPTRTVESYEEGRNWVFDDSDKFSGTVFTNAFVEVGGRMVRLNLRRSSPETTSRELLKHASPEAFFSQLSSSLSKHYTATKKHVQDSRGSGIEVFMQQQTQTLTLFDDRGVALP